MQRKYSEANKEVKRSAWRDRRRWTEEMAERAEQAMKKNNLKEVYRMTIVLSQKKSIRGGPVRSETGILLTNKDDQMARWKEYFNEILNQPVSINPDT